ncbi:MAG TPA: peptidylprolyl isomerase [bacterium]
MRRSWQAAAAAALAVALGGCDQISSLLGGGDTERSPVAGSAAPSTRAPMVPVAPEDVVARVNGVTLSKQDVELRVQELRAIIEGMGQPWTPLRPEDLQAVLEELINAELLSQDAAGRGLDQTLEAQRRWSFVRRGFLSQEWLRWQQERLSVEPSEVEAYYEQFKAGFRSPERMRVRQVMLATQDEARQALAQLLSDTVKMESLAQQSSLGPDADNGGLLPGWVVRAAERPLIAQTAAEAEAAGILTLDPSLEAAVFAIDQVGGYSSYVKGADNRYHIFQLVERQEGEQIPLSQVWDAIQNELLVRRLQEAIRGLSEQAAVERYPDRLEDLAR